MINPQPRSALINCPPLCLLALAAPRDLSDRRLGHLTKTTLAWLIIGVLSQSTQARPPGSLQKETKSLTLQALHEGNGVGRRAEQ